MYEIQCLFTMGINYMKIYNKPKSNYMCGITNMDSSTRLLILIEYTFRVEYVFFWVFMRKFECPQQGYKKLFLLQLACIYDNYLS